MTKHDEIREAIAVDIVEREDQQRKELEQIKIDLELANQKRFNEDIHVLSEKAIIVGLAQRSNDSTVVRFTLPIIPEGGTLETSTESKPFEMDVTTTEAFIRLLQLQVHFIKTNVKFLTVEEANKLTECINMAENEGVLDGEGIERKELLDALDRVTVQEEG